MGSPYLLAHGLGEPVTDATTQVKFPAPGNYRVWVRTKDWVAQWNAPGAPGRFQVLVNGSRSTTTFGTEGADWHWQDGGTVEIQSQARHAGVARSHRLRGALRCRAVHHATRSLIPPNADPALAEFRRKLLGLPEQPETAGEFDLVVAGGGIAGTCAAISAARLGLKVALVQDRPVLGGNNSSEVRVWLQGARNKEPYPRIGDIVAELEPAPPRALRPGEHRRPLRGRKETRRRPRRDRTSPCSSNTASMRVETDGRRIRSRRRAEHRQRTALAPRGRWFADCTGDAALGALAGADFEMTPEGPHGPVQSLECLRVQGHQCAEHRRSRAFAAGSLPALSLGA